MKKYSLNDQLPFGLLKGKTVRQVIDEHYWYFRNMLTWDNINFEEDVVSYNKEIRSKLYKLSRGIKY